MAKVKCSGCAWVSESHIFSDGLGACHRAKIDAGGAWEEKPERNCTGTWRSVPLEPAPAPPTPPPDAAGRTAAKMTRAERLARGDRECWGVKETATGEWLCGEPLDEEWLQPENNRSDYSSRSAAMKRATRAHEGNVPTAAARRFWRRKKPAPPPATTTVPVDRGAEVVRLDAALRAALADLAARDATIRELTAERDRAVAPIRYGDRVRVEFDAGVRVDPRNVLSGDRFVIVTQSAYPGREWDIPLAWVRRLP